MGKRVGIIGFGALGLFVLLYFKETCLTVVLQGQYLAEKIVEEKFCSLDFIYNRSVPKEPQPFIIKSLDGVSADDMETVVQKDEIDLVVEVAHPRITELYGPSILKHCDYMVGSPTVFSDENLLRHLINLSQTRQHRLFIPVGALWGAEDIMRMADRGTLKGVSVSMTKHPSCFRLEDVELAKLNDQALERNETMILYEGPVSKLCRMAPNNVNTMAVAAIAAHNIGMGKCIGKLISDPHLQDFHKIEVEVMGPQNAQSGGVFSVNTVRMNPAPIGGVTGQQTYVSFLSSLKNAISFPGPYGLRIC